MALSVDKAMRKALQFHRAGQLREAEAIYKEILARFPNNKRAFKSYQNLKRVITGEVLSTPEAAQEPMQALMSLYNQGRYEEVLTRAKILAKSFPEIEEIPNIQGLSNAALQNFDVAINCYSKALNINPDYAIVYNNLGNTLQDRGDLDAAIESYKQAIKIQPDYAKAYNNLGNALKSKSDPDAAIESYKQAIKIQPDYAKAYNNLGNVLQDKGDLNTAIESYKQALKIQPDYAEAQHLLASLTGKTTKSAPRTYVEKLFDSQALNFEHLLVDNLGYHSPKLLTEMVVQNHCGSSLGSILDLGCGTGLVGVEIKRNCQNLEGIDLSKSMLQLAKEKNIYDRLTHGDLIDYLSLENLDFDYFISADVFIYVGDLSNVFRLIKSRNKRSGKLAFSTEHSEKGGFFLEKSGRYSHSMSYIKSLCDEFDYRLSCFVDSDLRKEKGGFLAGGLYLLEF